MHSFYLHILISIIWNLNTFCINVHIHKMLLLQKKKSQGINTVIVIHPLEGGGRVRWGVGYRISAAY